ncbi:class I SAM-dependent methyltransferase [Candidatus Woesearchaeota archaeon]|nr:class I SAM-dependent methyltransferase [Candidatus Woesearchaeota archaeon]
MRKDEEVLKSIETLSESVFLPIVGREKGRFLEDVVRKRNPEKVLEIGTLVGYSAIRIARNLAEGMLTCIEISDDSARIARQNIRKAGFEKKVRVVVGDALNVIPNLGVEFELVFLDAAKDQYFAYLQLLEKNGNIGRGCVIVADNAWICGEDMKDYLSYVRNSSRYRSTFHRFGEDGMEVSIRQ